MFHPTRLHSSFLFSKSTHSCRKKKFISGAIFLSQAVGFSYCRVCLFFPLVWPIVAFRVTLRGIRGEDLRGRWKKAAILSCWSCFPFHRMLYFVWIFSFLITNTYWLVKKATVPRRPQQDLRLMSRRQGWPPAPSRFHLGPDVGGNGRVCVDDFKDRGDQLCNWTPPHTHHYNSPPSPLTNTQEGTHFTWMFDRYGKNKSCDPKLTSTLNWKRYDLKNTIGHYVWFMCTCIERNVI